MVNKNLTDLKGFEEEIYKKEIIILKLVNEKKKRKMLIIKL